MDIPLDVVTYGEAMALFVASTSGPLSEVEHFTRRVSGADLNVATGLARLGYRVGYITRVGRDAFGDHIRATLEREAIDQRCVTVDDRFATGFQLKGVGLAGEDPKTEYFRRGSAASRLSLDDYVAEYVLGSRHLHLTGIAPAISLSSRELAFHLAIKMRGAGKTVSFDPNLRPTLWPSRAEMVSQLNELAKYADWVFPGLCEGEILTGRTDVREIAGFYLERGARGVAVKLGEDGAYFRTEQEEGVVPGVRVERIVDTVGAGDGFAVGVVSGLLENMPMADAVARGNRIGALAIQVTGDSEGLPTRADLEALEQFADGSGRSPRTHSVETGLGGDIARPRFARGYRAMFSTAAAQRVEYPPILYFGAAR
ncbi:sugar kinase [Paraburkholderia fynbosensis]|uniref:2-dehydro-3-deoxygluconokinase n=1 Tax=Paraburkholderia fynbosensis TaxID=1200993 RepID=A0A6J5H1E7_9BURK|nr:sugar kinase [Paraburkholderia fynbosensis]CAB3810447.1 2-dehydro-3-deoxygluconokinase [Paraburkholderia fynbosensis]